MTEQSASNGPEQALITVASGKGGVGKTWLSVTLAHTLATAGKKVALFDGDLGLANVDIQLGITPEKDLGNVLSGEAEFVDIVVPVQERDGTVFDVLPGKSGSGALGSLSRDTLTHIRTKLVRFAAAYDYLLLDLAAGIDPSVTILSKHSGKILVVMTSDPTSLTDAYAFIKVTHMNNPHADIRIVVNNVKDKREGEQAYGAIKKACEGFLKISPPLMGIIRQDAKVVDAIRSQSPLLKRHPTADAATDVKQIAAKLIG